MTASLLEGQGMVWYCLRRREWMVDMPGQGGEPVSMPLGVRGRRHRQRALAELAGVLFDDAPTVAGCPLPGQPTVWFAAAEGRWVLTVPCSGCGQYPLALRVTDPEHFGQARLDAARMRGLWASGPCSGCVTRRARFDGQLMDAGQDAGQWFDTVTQQWTLTVRIGGTHAVSLPLGCDAMSSAADVAAAVDRLGYRAPVRRP